MPLSMVLLLTVVSPSDWIAELDSIRDCIAFPKNNSGRDVMIDAPARLDPEQLDELHLTVRETL